MMEDNSNQINIIILNYITWQNTYNCILSLKKNTSLNFKVIIVDNYSGNKSLEKLKKNLGSSASIINENEIYSQNIELKKENIFFIQCNKNHGYAKGNNLGIKFSERIESDYTLILNNDTIHEQSFLENMINGFSYKKNVGLVTSMIYDNHGNFDKNSARKYLKWYYVPLLHKENFLLNNFSTYYTFKSEEALIDSGNYVEIDDFSGCCLLVRSKILKEIGYFDENTFLYFEEIILLEKIRKLNLIVLLSTKSKVYHIKGQTTKLLNYVETKMANINSLRYYLEYYRKINHNICTLLLLPHYYLLYKIKIKKKIKSLVKL